MALLRTITRPRALATLLVVSVLALGATVAHRAGAEIPESKWVKTGVTLKPGTDVKNRMAGVAAHQYTYVAPRDGAVRVTMVVLPVAGENKGVARRPYLRLLRGDGTAEAWTSNGNQIDPNKAIAVVAVKMKKGDKFNVIAATSANNDASGAVSTSPYVLSLKESDQ